MDALQFFFDNVLINPMLNILVGLYDLLFNQFGLAIIVFTIAVRVATLPLHMKQINQIRSMQALQPRMKELQERYKNDPQRRSRETMQMYRSAGVNPLGCLGPMLVQFPIWIALYQALLNSLGTTPDHLVGLSQRLYSWNPVADAAIPLSANFLWLDLANPDPTPLLPVLVGASTWAQQRMTTMPSTDERQAQTNRMMQWMFPLMLGFLAFSFPSGLALYWTVSNVIGVVTQYFITKDLSPLLIRRSTPVPEPLPAQLAGEPPPKEIEQDGSTRSVRKNRRRSNRGGPEGTRRKAGRGRSRDIKPR